MKFKDDEKQIIIDVIHERINGTNHKCFILNKKNTSVLKKFFKDCISKKYGQYLFDYGKFDLLKYPDLYIEAYRQEIEWVNNRFFPNNKKDNKHE